MSAATDSLLPEGLRDSLPEQAAAEMRTMRAVTDVLHAHGYDRIRPPLIEFERSLATRAEGLSTRRMFRFVDPASLRTLALRADITPQVGRIAATSLAGAPRPLRLCYAGDVALITADQLDPLRQRLQMGGELIGSDSVPAAAEIVRLAVSACRAAGVGSVALDFTLPDLVDTLAGGALPLGAGQVDAVRDALDMKDAGALCAAGGDAYLPLLYAAGPFDTAIAQLTAFDRDGLLASRLEGLRAIQARLADEQDVRVTLDPTERHGFEYQSWLGFTLYADGARGALGRGGTYRIGGTDEVATGFSLYMEPLLEAADPASTPAALRLFLPMHHDPRAAQRLRAQGWRTVAALSEHDDAAQLGCTHRLDGDEPVPLS
ncbi:ATP phosphoribosyltransferase regulatory subunit [Erythrobacteraceae bacterium CFH 75059]|uniref:ATP phosphoribosyltransferase regulatory subunit n=1 Tax=Qipengyuania thermophila TaxID=2509361 RepID=UPI00101EF767|nr:ATP phosphoribosyltransferase regulatory subunit [Qipengyuania thermophila]TCD02290.1 ATP phosphoribosyltransferase regulatory subunit [Erythrobacteraceae bacterium CFH 75059]